MLKLYIYLVLFLFNCITISQLNAAKILALAPFPGRSQSIAIQPYFKELASRGHELTVITAYPQKQPVKNYRDIDVSEIIKLNDALVSSMLDITTKWDELNSILNYGEMNVRNVIENAEVQKLLRTKTHFDLMIVETFYTEALYGMAEQFGAHLIGISTFGTIPCIDDLVGNASPISYIPLLSLSFTDRMNYWQRLQNLALHSIEFVHYHMVHLPNQEKLYNEVFPNAKQNLLEVRKNFSLVFVNQHFSLSFPRPYVPNMVQIGGFHLSRDPPGTLPVEMQHFLNESGSSGVIYFSMGTNIKSSTLPKEKLAIIMRTFAALKQRVMWKFEDTELPGKPDNVFISKWFPQQDILAHPSVKLFITHCGLLSTMEAIYHGKPVLGMPMFLDQFLNAKRAEQSGFALNVDFKELTIDDFSDKIKKLIEDPKYAKSAAAISHRYHDQPLEPMQAAIYWTEYVLRHDGAAHMRNAGQDLNFIQYHSLDTIVSLFGGIFLVIVLIVWLVIKLICLVFSDSTKKKLKKK